ncbi:MAG TPA: alpha-amylase family glycosyl hydrolase [Desulfosalsimonadaceae bacterium]|nr:alpha-amylase family glycosyl hydrolase [Desulfosalsimonadaceae bacterium]
MSSLSTTLSSAPPASIDEALEKWPERQYWRSPRDWRDNVFYFLLPDRFSNGEERADRLLDADLSSPEGISRIRQIRGAHWRWDRWQSSGAERFQGGSLKGVRSKLGYLSKLGITTLWIGPVFRQRVEGNTYHGYGIQDFFDVDPRFGGRQDLLDLVDTAHSRYGMYVVLDVIFNHSGSNWLYDQSAGDPYTPPYRSRGGYEPIWPRNGYGSAIYDFSQIPGRDDFVWPRDLQEYQNYVRAGKGDLGRGDLNDAHAEHKRTDFGDLRKFNLFSEDTLRTLVLAYHYWIALADIDGFRIDTFKHVSQDQARNFCNAIKEYAEVLGKENFLLVAEVAGGDNAQDRYLDVTGRNLSACLDIGGQREAICLVSKGLAPGTRFFNGFSYYDEGMGSHRNYGSKHLSISNDHDHVFGPKIRLSADASNDHQAAAAAGLQLFSLGIPCLYYGMEQGLAGGAEPEQRKYLSHWGGSDCLLRETMFGPESPLAAGYEGGLGAKDTEKPGFGPHGTAGWHVFNEQHPVFRRIAQMTKVRKAFAPLRKGRQYPRQIALPGLGFGYAASGEIIAWSRIYNDQEVLVILNPHGTEAKGAGIIVDHRLSKDGMKIIMNTDPSAVPEMQKGAVIDVRRADCGACYISIAEQMLGPSEIMVLGNPSAIRHAPESELPRS